VIEAKDLTKRYGGRLAVDDPSFTVRPGVTGDSVEYRGAGIPNAAEPAGDRS
jgi:ABC-2 type transport system ATP-binding protein